MQTQEQVRSPAQQAVRRIQDHLDVIAYLQPIVEKVIDCEVPSGPRTDGWEPMITAEK